MVINLRIILLSFLITTTAYSEVFHNTADLAESKKIREEFNIVGIVTIADPDVVNEAFVDLAASRSEEEFEQKLMELLKEKPAVNAVVVASGEHAVKQAVTDIHGKFAITNLPHGVYDLCAKMPLKPGAKKMATAKKRIDSKSNRKVNLQLHSNFVTVKGRVVDIYNRPVQKAKVTGSLFPLFGYGTSDSISTLSDNNGFYELKGFIPPHIYIVAGYLNGGNPVAGQNPFYVEITVENDGYLQDKENTPRIPLVTENILKSARFFLNVMQQFSTKQGRDEFREKENLTFPPSTGNTITGIDIVLEKEK